MTNPNRQNGFVLFTGMMLLIVLGVVGVAAMSNSLLEEKMAHNTQDKQQSFQAAESALRFAQQSVLHKSAEFIESNTYFYNTRKDVTQAPNLAYPGSGLWSGTNSYQLATSEIAGTYLAEKPRVVVEKVAVIGESLKIGKGPRNPETEKAYYRLTSRGVGQTATAQSTTQSVVER